MTFIGNNLILPHIKIYNRYSDKNLILLCFLGLCGNDNKSVSSTNIAIIDIMEAWAGLYQTAKSSSRDWRRTIIFQLGAGGGQLKAR
jgi:hypothetical protein